MYCYTAGASKWVGEGGQRVTMGAHRLDEHFKQTSKTSFDVGSEITTFSMSTTQSPRKVTDFRLTLPEGAALVEI